LIRHWKQHLTAAAMVAMASAVLAEPDKTSPAPGTLTVTLSPEAPDAQGNIPYVDVRVTADSIAAAKGQPFLRLALVSANVDSIANTLEGLRASDAKGPLTLSTRDDAGTGPEVYRQWVADRAIEGQVTIQYRAPITNRLNARGAAPPFELRTEDGGFSGDGGIFLVLPESANLYRIKLAWNFSAVGPDAVGESSLGPGDVTFAAPARADVLANTYFMGGNIHHYPDVLAAHGFLSVWQGTPPFDTRALMAWTQTLYDYYTKFFRQTDAPPYAVFLRRNLVNAGGGVEVGRSFVGTFDKNTDPKDLKLTLAHEMVHTFVGTLGGSKSLDSSWYSEGLAVYYQRLLPLRAGAISPADFLTDLNSTAGRYYTDLLNDTPNDQIAARFWADTRIRVLPYDRGSLYFAQLNAEIRNASGGKRSLDQLVQTMIDRKAQGLPSDQGEWVSLVEADLGAAGKQQFEDMLAGKLIVPAPDAFGPCYTRTTATLRRYELGFDSAVLAEPSRIVRGLVPGSAAERAGLRNGDRIVKPVPQDAIQSDQHATLTLLVERDGKEFAVTYLPRGEAVRVYQWRRVAGVPDAECRLQ
jgi:hypothetical protein